jgi:DNA-binding SARP family transcriptional activator
VLDFRILGPLEVSDGERRPALGGPQQRAVLAILLLHANEAVSADRLVDELWGERPPASARAVLQGYVSNLRKALGAAAIATGASGYAVEIEPGQLDLRRFERFLAEGREALAAGSAEAASRLLGEALALWRGPALADFAYERFARPAAVRLEELRVTALENRIEADLALARHGSLVGELEALVAEHPLRERLRGQLMLALYRSGRQAEALAAYQAARRTLVDELGIEPTPALAELERAILRHDSSLQVAAGTEAPPAPPLALPPPERSVLVVPREGANLDALLALAEPLARRPPRELILAGLVPGDADLAAAAQGLQERRAGLIEHGVPARAAAFTSDDPGSDVVRLAAEQAVDLVLLDASPDDLDRRVAETDLGAVLESSPCDIGILVVRDGAPAVISPGRPVLVPFGGADHDWTAAEIGAWIASVQDAPLRLLGAAADPDTGRRDASRLLASASLLVQQLTRVTTEPVLAPPGEAGVLEAAAEAGLVVVGLSASWRQEGIGPTRLAVARGSRPPMLLVRRGVRPGGIAPRETLTRFTWSLATGRG